MMLESDAHEYYYRVIKSRPAPLSREDEQKMFAPGIFNIQAIGEQYLYLAAYRAKDWYEKHGRKRPNLGECIEAANTGLMMAAAIFYKNKHSPEIRFSDYCQFFIDKELAKITHGTDTK
jgi:hypothetical protein